jgi:hypothetical protein
MCLLAKIYNLFYLEIAKEAKKTEKPLHVRVKDYFCIKNMYDIIHSNLIQYLLQTNSIHEEKVNPFCHLMMLLPAVLLSGDSLLVQ